VLRHRFHDYGAKPTPLWCVRGRSIALDPAHGEAVAVGPPADIDTTGIHRECPVFPPVGSELMEHEPDGLRESSLQLQLGAVDGNARTNEVGQMRQLGQDQVLDLDPIPFVPDEQVLTGPKAPGCARRIAR
jgi:hypothetical protein